MEIAFVLGLLLVALVLFATEILSVDVVTILLLIALVVTGVLTPAESFAGFSSEIIIILVSIFVLSGALQKTGVLDALGSRLYRTTGQRSKALMLSVMATVGGVSAFMNNTTATAIFLPPVLGLARKAKVSPSKLLMPLAYGSILGGTCTLIGTSTNVAVSGYITKAGMAPVSLFEITGIGLILLAVGIVYMLLVGHRLLPDHRADSPGDAYGLRKYLSEIVVLPDSPLVGQEIFQSDLSRLNFRILQVVRGEQSILPDPETRIEGSDLMLVEGDMQELMKVQEMAGVGIRRLQALGDSTFHSEDARFAEALIMPQSTLIGRTLKEVNFRQRYGLTAVAIYRHGHSLCDRVGRIILHVGDVLLLHGHVESLHRLRQKPELAILGEQNPPIQRQKRGAYTIILFVIAMALGGFGLCPLSVAFLSAATVAILLRCITVDEAYKFIDWRLIVLIAGMTAFGTAMEKSGAAGFLADSIIRLLEPFGVMAILAGFVFLTILLTQPMSNAAAALVVLPLALNAAERLGMNGRTFAIAIMLAASVSIMTPLEPSCVLVYGPGKFRFIDFIRVGSFLTVLLATVILILLPVFWPLTR